MSTRFAAFTAATMAKLGLAAAAPAAEPAVPAAAPAEPAKVEETPVVENKDGDPNKPTAEPVDDTEAERAIADAATQAASAGASAERTRWSTVMRSPAAKGRETVAIATLEKSPMSADAIIAMLGDMPAAGATGFADRMAAEAANPSVTADGDVEKPAERNALTILRERHSKKG